MAAPSLEQLRRYAIGRSLFKPTTLIRAVGKLGFVQADPIRAPARAQDLTLRHRVKDYRAGDLERAYPRLALEEDFAHFSHYSPLELKTMRPPRTKNRTRAKLRRSARGSSAKRTTSPGFPTSNVPATGLRHTRAGFVVSDAST